MSLGESDATARGVIHRESVVLATLTYPLDRLIGNVAAQIQTGASCPEVSLLAAA